MGHTCSNGTCVYVIVHCKWVIHVLDGYTYTYTCTCSNGTCVYVIVNGSYMY